MGLITKSNYKDGRQNEQITWQIKKKEYIRKYTIYIVIASTYAIKTVQSI